MPSTASSPTTSELPPRIVLYDGVCGLCNRTVKWLMKRDGGAFHYAPLQGETAAALRAKHARIPQELDSVVFVEDGRVYLRSKVFLVASRWLGWPWKVGYWFRWLPGFLLDWMYWIVAKLRYRIFGKYDSCTLPTTDERAKLLP
jgi:predicted DCC family thiol-disulfide oxidoreductase YuxK